MTSPAFSEYRLRTLHRIDHTRLKLASHLHISPNTATLTGLGLSVIASVLLLKGWLLASGLVLTLALVMDMLDGAIARSSGRATTFGAFLDSISDRYSEGMVYIALVWHLLIINQPQMVILGMASLFGAMSVSYIRARAQSLSIACEGGWFARPARSAVIVIGLLLGPIAPMVWILAIGTNFTALQRIRIVWKQSHHHDRKG